MKLLVNSVALVLKTNKCACVLINRVRKYFYNKHFGNIFCRVPPGKDPVSNR